MVTHRFIAGRVEITAYKLVAPFPTGFVRTEFHSRKTSFTDMDAVRIKRQS